MNVQKIARYGFVTATGVGILAAAFLGDTTFKKGKASAQEVTVQTLKPTDSIDVTKPNLPLIGKDFIQYRGLDGKVNKVVSTDETAAVYNAIAKMSTEKEPDILEPEEFYTEVQKNIHADNDTSVYTDKSINNQIYKMRMSDLFDKAFKMATAFESEDGSVITVREYTRLMDTFSKAGQNKTNQ